MIVDLTECEYMGTLSNLDHTNRTSREQRGKYKANKAVPRGMRSNPNRQRRLVRRDVIESATMHHIPDVMRHAALQGAQKGID